MQQDKITFCQLLADKAGFAPDLDERLIKVAQEHAWKVFSHAKKSWDLDLQLEGDYLVIVVRMKDYAFIVDSLLVALKNFSMKQSFISIPVFAVTRKQNGEIEAFNDENLSHQEAISLFIFKTFAPLQLEEIRVSLEEVLSMIVAVNEGWEGSKASAASLDQEFCDWLLDNNFIFLASFDCEKGVTKNLLGLVTTPFYSVDTLLEGELFNQDLNFRRSSLLSRVHRNTNMEIITIKKGDSNYSFFVGFFTSAVYFQPVTTIPFIREKIATIFNKNHELTKYGYLSKEVIAQLQSYPRSELFQITQEELETLVSGLVSMIKFPRIKIFMREGSDLFHSLLIFIPKEKFSMDLQAKIEEILTNRLSLDFFKRYMKISEGPFMTLQFIAKPRQKVVYNLVELEAEIEELLSDWEAKLQALLIQTKVSNVDALQGIFPLDYRCKNSPQEALEDLVKLEKLSLYPSFYLVQDNKIKIYSKERLEISDLIPKLDNLAFAVVEMEGYDLLIKEENFYLYTFIVRPIIPTQRDINFLQANMQRVIFNPQLEDDQFNKLILLVGLTWEEVLVARAYSAYLKQLRVAYDNHEIITAFSQNPQIALLLFQLFRTKFSQNVTREKLLILQTELEKLIFIIEDALADKIFRDYLELIKATTRSNIAWGSEVEFLALKIVPQELSLAPLPKPYREIFVYSKEFEGLHMRNNKIARGGIRWSDRKFDYRTELLGLLKAQMSKNSIIVPDGAKGIFILKNISPQERDLFMQKGIQAYEAFLSGLLDLTDNFINNKLILTDKTIIWDEADPYLVVAADKGTATFSDRANNLALQRNFWLGDAFASGGSAGYDHKKLAITSKGAWIAVEEHSKHLKLNPNQDLITVIGIGDMSGDVFGNGLLRSKTLQLVAAFNHMHIFLDPHPDPIKSYEERLRLFNLPYSQWKDYNPELISKGGGVFDRKAKIIPLSSEIQEILGIEATIRELKPDHLIQAILKAPVDLLWNGGIGTYVKASYESQEAAGDKSNDTLRVDAKELKCKMVAEGGNLGFTQLGRVEYARQGGLINTDAIDNSGGVDCSDHEVNIKIALASLGNQLSFHERNQLLSELALSVVDLVLADNKRQNHILSLCQKSHNIEEKIWLIKTLEEMNILNPKLEKLPSYEQLEELDSLTRPELSVLLAYVKNSAVAILLQEKKLENLLELEPFRQIYLNYFPTKLQKTPYVEALDNHKLKREILATVLINEMINDMGLDYFHLRWLRAGINPLILVKNFFIVKYGLNLHNSINTRQIQLLMEEKMANLSNELPNDFYHKLCNLNILIGDKALELLMIVKNPVINYLDLYNNYLWLKKTFSIEPIEFFNIFADQLHYDAKIAILILVNGLEEKLILLALKLQENPQKRVQFLEEVKNFDEINNLSEQNSAQILASLIILEQKLDTILAR